MDLKDGRFVLGIWFIPQEWMDWLGTLYREAKDSPDVLLEYRFRYYATPGDPFDGKDEKHWFVATMRNVSNEEAVANTAVVAAKLAADMESEAEHLSIMSDNPLDTVTALASKSWAHMRMEEGVKEGGGTTV